MPPDISELPESASLGSLIRANIANLGSKLGRVMKTSGERRDGLLLAAGVLYLLGYLTWAWYGYVNGIGFIPVFDAQYFASGVVPAAVICLFLIGLRTLGAIDVWLQHPPTPGQTKVGKILTIIAVVGILLFGAISFFVGKSKPPWLEWIMFAAVILMLLGPILERGRGIKLFQRFMIWIVRFYLFLSLLFVGVYVERVMPVVPTEWGGARARCILLDVDSAQISPDTRRRFFGEGEALSAQGVLRTAPLHLIYDGSEYFFLLEHAGRPSAKTNPVFRLRKDTVKGVFPCNS
jgi:hypothetical protein